MILPGLKQTIAQRVISNGTNDSANFGATPSSSSIVIVAMTCFPASNIPTVTVGGITASQTGTNPINSISGRFFYAYGSFSSATVSITMGAGSYYWWAAEEWSNLALQAPAQFILGAGSTSPTHCTVSTAALTVAPAVVFGLAINGATQATSGWSPPTNYYIGALNKQDWNNTTSGCLVRRVTTDTSAQTLTMTGAGTLNYGRISAIEFSGLNRPISPIMFGSNS